ncbi:hypothetical protein [Francisella sp. SYW-9]|uniref:hypothetical protein n=1 Tax=Francisella sp. SYW-9 TaxID=2610888 RepID=UPI00123CDA4F|nr:hypothetical protein [Francisella sp. SYW-9]
MTSSELTELIYTNLKTKFSNIKWLLYPHARKIAHQDCPFALISLDSMTHTKKMSDLSNVMFFVSLTLVYSRADEKEDNFQANLDMTNVALEIGTFLESNFLANSSIKTINVTSSQRDSLSPSLDGFIAWEIELQISTTFGDSVYAQ